MPFSNYTELQSSVADWLHRADLAAVIPDFILLAEKDFNRRFNVTPKELSAALTLTAGAQAVNLPVDYATPVALWNELTQPRWELPLMTVAEMPRNSATATGPCAWAIDGAQIVFDYPADQNYPLTLRYVQSVFLKDAAGGANTMLTRYPDLYLYGALAQSAPYMRDDGRIAVWQAKYEQIIAGARAEASRDKAAPLRMDLPRSTTGRSGFNINRGW